MKKKRGAALAMVLLLVMLLSIIVGAMYTVFANNNKAIDTQGISKELYYYARMGTELGRLALFDNNQKLYNHFATDSSAAQLSDNFDSGDLSIPDNIKINLSIGFHTVSTPTSYRFIRVLSTVEDTDSNRTYSLNYYVDPAGIKEAYYD